MTPTPFGKDVEQATWGGYSWWWRSTASQTYAKISTPGREPSHASVPQIVLSSFCPALGEQGGMRLTQVQQMVASLQAKIISRLLEPERLKWKDFALLHFGRSQQSLSSHPHISRRTVDVLGYGVRESFSLPGGPRTLASAVGASEPMPGPSGGSSRTDWCSRLAWP